MSRREERAAGSHRPADPTHHGELAQVAITPVDARIIRQTEVAQEFRADDTARRAAEALERRQGDITLLTELAAAGFGGRLWRQVSHELACYGHAVVVAWLWTNEMFAQCKHKGCYPGPPPVSWQDDDVQSLANDTVTRAISDFHRRALVLGGWNQHGGASLKTYFVGSCVFAFPNFYRKWCSEQDKYRQAASSSTHTDDIAGLSSSERDPAYLALQRVHLWTSFNALPDDRTKKVILLQEMGYQLDEIAELLNEPRGAVKGLLERHRKRGRSNQAERGSHV